MSFRIFAGNLAFQVTDEDLREVFSAFGTVTFARVILDRDTGKSRGFGFVEIDGDDAGKRALAALDGTDFKGRQFRLKEAEPRGGPGGGGGGPGGGGGRRHEGPPRGPRPERGGRPPGGGQRGPGGGAPPRTFPDDDGAQQRRRTEAKKAHKAKSGEDRQRGFGGAAANQGKPQEKVRGGAKNRFRVDDDEDDEDIDLFGKFHDAEEEDYDISAIEGVELGDDEEGTGGIRIEIDRDEEDKK